MSLSELPRSARNVRLSERGRGTRRVALFFIAFGVAAVLWLTIDLPRQILRREVLRRDGRQTIAKIENVGTYRGSGWRVKYVFVVDGNSIRNEVRIPSSMVDSLIHTDSLPIRYVPSDPENNHPAGWEWTAAYELVLVVPLAWSVPGFLLLNKLRQERQLAFLGVVAIGTVTSCSPDRKLFKIKYEFRAQDGIVIEGTGSSPLVKEVGASIDVLYLSDNPLLASPYPMENFEIADGAPLA